jgi:hypothetical protein
MEKNQIKNRIIEYSIILARLVELDLGNIVIEDKTLDLGLKEEIKDVYEILQVYINLYSNDTTTTGGYC